MEPNEAGEVTRLLRAATQGDIRAQSDLAGLIYEQLHRIARSRMRAERRNHTLQPTALVNEAFIQLLRHGDVSWQNRSHFFGVAAQAMRRILIDHARAARAKKRGGGELPPQVPTEIPIEVRDPEEALAVNEALTRLEKLNPRQSRVVELRYFVGMTEDEVAQALGVSSRTIKRDWDEARKFLKRELGGDTAGQVP